MNRVFLLGYPLGHSISPALQNAAFAALDLDWRYELLETAREDLDSAVARLRREDSAGANVTIPHKQAVVAWLDSVSDRARRIGAVNTLVKREGKLFGDNTDGQGFLESLRDAHVDLQDKVVALLGAGGAARAVAFSIAEAGAARIAILNRTAAHAEALADSLQAFFPSLELGVNPADTPAVVDLIVNATSVGMYPDTDRTPLPVPVPPGAVVFDLVYRPAQTRLMREAANAGARTLGGMGMLVHQGAAAFTLWTGRKAPLEVMFEAARAALQ
jgi:shikimate dehydrogenase